MDSLRELEIKVGDNINFIIEVAKEEKRLRDTDVNDERLSGMKAVMLDCIKLQKKLKNFQKAVNQVESEKANSAENLEDVLMEQFEALNAEIDDDLTGHRNYKQLIGQFDTGSLESEAAASAENLDEDAEHSMVVTQEVNIPLDPITKKHLVDPVVNTICHHMYERAAIMEHIAKRLRNARCPVSGCGNTHVLHQGVLEEAAEMRQLIERNRRGDESFFN